MKNILEYMILESMKMNEQNLNESNYKTIARKYFQNHYKYVKSTGMMNNLMIFDNILGIDVHSVDNTSATDGLTKDQINRLPYSVQRYSYTDWNAAEGIVDGIQVGFIIKQAAFSAEVFIFTNTPEDMDQIRQKLISSKMFTNRKNLKDRAALAIKKQKAIKEGDVIPFPKKKQEEMPIKALPPTDEPTPIGPNAKRIPINNK